MRFTSQNKKRSLIGAILITGFIAALLAITGAILAYYILNGRIPYKILEYIASAAFGAKAYSGGIAMNLAGALFHLLIAMCFTILFFMLYPKIKLLRANKILVGFIYGAFVWVIMNLVILPMTQIPKVVFQIKHAAIGMLTLMLCIGLPISIMASNYYRNKKNY